MSGLLTEKEEKKMNGSIIQVTGVKKSYKDIEVLRGVDIEVEKGGFLHY
ncbi:protein of unknown function [Petrocella atlantisensis]|uniref:Uncharacterized protein n=1 Tax=Petrocella atlantisensis TaxID=2173034 RepID=A0A3P7S3W4_9FIRM|nr:protein of unknown function [Petrocella atlantisensis]